MFYAGRDYTYDTQIGYTVSGQWQYAEQLWSAEQKTKHQILEQEYY
jgi:hypothetical protein